MDFDVDTLHLEISQQLGGEQQSLAEITERLLQGNLSRAEQVSLGARLMKVLGGDDFKDVFVELKKPKHRPRVGYGKFRSCREDFAVASERIRRAWVANGRLGKDCKMQAYSDLGVIVELTGDRVSEIVKDPRLSVDPLSEEASQLDVLMFLDTLPDIDLLRYRLPDELESAIAGLVRDLSRNGKG